MMVIGSNKMNEQELVNLKKKIDKAKTQASELKGRKDYLHQELQNKYNCTTTKEAKALIASMNADIKKIEKLIEKGLIKIERDYIV